MNQVSIPVSGGHVRRLQDPTNEGRFSYYAFVRVSNLPADLPLDVNPRKQNLSSPIAKKIRGGFENEPHVFHLLNRGLTIIAQDASYNNRNGILTLEFPEGDSDYFQENSSENDGKPVEDEYDMDAYVGVNSYGIVDGGHTYKIILQETERMKKAQEKSQKDPFVRLEVLVGVEDMAIPLARARNTSAQVKEQSLANLGRKFDWLKKLFEGKDYENLVAYRENEKDKPIDIREIIRFLAAFHPKYLSREQAPILSYTSAGRCLKMFVTEEESRGKESTPEGFRRLKPIVIDILELYAHIQATFADQYRKLGGMKGIRQGKTDGDDASSNGNRSVGKPGAAHEFETYTTPQPVYFTNESTPHKPAQGLLMPLLSAFRVLVKINPETQLAEWKANPRAMYDRNAEKYVKMIFQTNDELGRKPNAVGKSRNLWNMLYQEVMMDYLQEQGALQEYV